MTATAATSAMRCLRVAFALYGLWYVVVGTVQAAMALWADAPSSWMLVTGGVTAGAGLLLLSLERPLAAFALRRTTALPSTPACYLAAGLFWIGAVDAFASIQSLVAQMGLRWLGSSELQPLPPLRGLEQTEPLVLAACGVALALASSRLAVLWVRWNARPVADRA